jgi:hypothetical protein
MQSAFIACLNSFPSFHPYSIPSFLFVSHLVIFLFFLMFFQVGTLPLRPVSFSISPLAPEPAESHFTVNPCRVSAHQKAVNLLLKLAYYSKSDFIKASLVIHNLKPQNYETIPNDSMCVLTNHCVF